MGASGYDPKKKKVIQQERNYNITSDEESKKIFESLPKDQYLCPFCGDIPELLNIHTDNGYVEFRCKKDKEFLISVQDYFKKLSESNFTYYNIKCSNCNKEQKSCLKKEQLFKYCYLCKKDFCYECVEKEIKEHDKSHLKKCIPINEKNTRCLEHFGEGQYTSFCNDCHINICEENSHVIHRKHHITNFFKIEPQIKVITEKNRILSDIIRFNELILNTYQKFPDNYFHLVNMSNLAESIMIENSRNSEELNFIFEQLKLKIKNREDAIKAFNEKFKMLFTGKEEILSLRKIGLEDDDLKTLSQIGFSKLKEIDISENKLNDISCLKDINLSNVELLKMNNNNIRSLNVFTEINAPKLEILELQRNKIQSVGPLLKSELPSLQLLRIEDNNDLEKSIEEFNQLLKKYTKKLIYKTYTYQDFNKKYDCILEEKSREIKLADSQLGNEILKDLYILSSKYEKIEKLVLSNNNIDDISLLSKMKFLNLKTLDLSLNQIKSIEPLSKMRLDHLTTLFFKGNNTSDFTPLTSTNFKTLKYVDISGNNIIEGSIELNKIVNDLAKKRIKLEINN
jgi:Leucine-rich repeat (LRR) protein